MMEPFAGLYMENDSPEAASTHFPDIKHFFGLPRNARAFGLTSISGVSDLVSVTMVIFGWG